MTVLPSHARFVIIGGGIIGCSTAYHLAKFGAKEIVLLERHKLTSGSTHHAAGLVGQLRSSANITRLLKYSVELYRTLEAETGQATGWKMNGGLRLACNAERMQEIKRQATTAHSFGLEMNLLSPVEAKELWPPMESSDLVGAAFLPTDGQASPSDIAMALAKGARMGGVRIIEEVSVTGLTVRDGRIEGVRTDRGDVRAEIVVNCAGLWAGEVGRLAGVMVPVQPIEHQYLITEPCGVPRNLPTLRDPDRLIYYKEEVGGFVMGGYEPNPIPWGVEGIPRDFAFALLDERWDHFEQLMTQALARTPILETAGVKSLLCGPEAFTPDGNFILGEAPEVKNFFLGCGFNAFGIASGGGAGWALAQWILEGVPPLDLWPVDIRRFAPSVHGDVRYVRERTMEAYGKHYTMAWPHEEYGSMRPYRTSRLYPKLKAERACFGSKLGWERPNWFAPEGVEPADKYSYGRQNWFAAVGDEHRAARERVALFDQSSFAKFEVSGRGAEAALSWIAANDISRPAGHLAYAQLLNVRGGIECDLTIARLAPEHYYIVTGTGFRTHDLAWIRGNVPQGAEVAIRDVTDERGCLALMGPRARDTLSQVTGADLSNPAFPFASVREIEVSGVRVRALRITYVGELGWELHMPIEGIDRVYDALMQAGKKHGIANAGYRAIESLRLEKGYCAWGADINADSTPLEARLGFAVKLKRDIPFLGRAALEAQTKRPFTRMLATFVVRDQDVVLLGRETIFRDGEQVGYLTSGGYGYTIAANIGMGYVRRAEGLDREYLMAGRYQLEVATERVPAEIHLRPLYDPEGMRIKA